MWNNPNIDDLMIVPPQRVLSEGYSLNIRPALLTEDLRPFVVTPRAPARVWEEDIGQFTAPVKRIVRYGVELEVPDLQHARRDLTETVCLLFPNLETAKSTTLGQYWIAP